MQQIQHVESQVEYLLSLGSTLRAYKPWFMAWFLILLLENCVAPLILYYVLRYETHIKLWLTCTLITCVWGMVLYVEYAIRIWKLIYRWPITQPLRSSCIATSGIQSDHNDSRTLSGAPAEERAIRWVSIAPSAPSRWSCDASHWLFSSTLAITLGELIIATVPKEPYLRLLAMVNPSMLFLICLFILLLDIAFFLRIRSPFRISSVAKGEFIRPGVYTLLEDVIAVDLGQGYIFRTRFNECWEVSPIFRRLLYQLSIFWSIPGVIISGTCTILIFTIDLEVGFAIGWGLPFLWVILWAAITVVVVGRWLKSQQRKARVAGGEFG